MIESCQLTIIFIFCSAVEYPNVDQKTESRTSKYKKQGKKDLNELIFNFDILEL